MDEPTSPGTDDQSYETPHPTTPNEQSLDHAAVRDLRNDADREAGESREQSMNHGVDRLQNATRTEDEMDARPHHTT